MKYFSLILTLFLCISGVNASAIEEASVDADPASAAWKTNPCLAMLAREIQDKHNVVFQFRNGVSLRSTASDPRCDDEENKDDGISWKCRDEISWRSDIARNVTRYALQRYVISYPDLRAFFLAEQEVEKDEKMYALWQILFAEPGKSEDF